MNKISQKQINDAAKDHARETLGNQFKINPDAVQAVTTDFKAGVSWLIKIQKQK